MLTRARRDPGACRGSAVATALALLIAGCGDDVPASGVSAERTAPRTQPDASAATTEPQEAPRPEPPMPERRPVRAGDLVISGITGSEPSKALLKRARSGRIAGVILMGRNIRTVSQVQRLTGRLQAAAADGGQPPLLVMVDQEGGTVQRFRSAAPRVSARELSRLPLSEVEAAGGETGRDLLQRGANVNLAPVVDVRHSEANFLDTRAFGTTASAVARNACRFADGLRSAGVVPTLKHFPGLGEAGATNTDFGAVSLEVSLGSLRQDWLPYRTCGTVPGTLVMMSNASYPALTGRRPAVLSRATYAEAARLGLPGPFVTDALGAASVRNIPSVASKAINAGAHLALYTEEWPAARGERDIARNVDARVLEARSAAVRALRQSVAR